MSPPEPGRLRRHVLAQVAESNPHLSRAVLLLWDELRRTDALPPPAVLRRYGEQVRELGVLIEQLADALAQMDPPPVIDSPN